VSKDKTTDAPVDLADKAEWTVKIVAPHLAAEQERRAGFATSSGVPLERLYSHEDWPAGGASPGARVGYPGAYPFTRGVTPTMYRGQFWVMGMYSG